LGVGGKIERQIEREAERRARHKGRGGGLLAGALVLPKGLAGGAGGDDAPLGPAGGRLSPEIAKFRQQGFPVTNTKFWDNLAAAQGVMDRYEADQRVVKR